MLCTGTSNAEDSTKTQQGGNMAQRQSVEALLDEIDGAAEGATDFDLWVPAQLTLRGVAVAADIAMGRGATQIARQGFHAGRVLPKASLVELTTTAERTCRAADDVAYIPVPPGYPGNTLRALSCKITRSKCRSTSGISVVRPQKTTVTK